MSAEWRSRSGRWVCWLGPVLLIALGLTAYADIDRAQFVFDDIHMLEELAPGTWPFDELHNRRKDGTAAGRPVMAASWAANLYFASTRDGARLPEPRFFQAVNLGVHLGAGLVLLLLARQLFRRIPEIAPWADGLALAAASLWIVHPVTTGSVTYLAQRAEALMALFFLSALLAAWHSLDARYRGAWITLATVSAWLSVGSKEVGALVPIAFWLIHRALTPEGFGSALRRNAGLYAGLCSSWLLFGALLATEPRTETVAWLSDGLHPLNYLLTQANALVHYASLLVWPHPLVIDYGWPVVQVHSAGDLWTELPVYGPALAAVGAGFALATWGLARAPRATLPLALAFLVLAPSSSILPINTEIMAEHRVYLPAAILLVGGVGWLGRGLAGRPLWVRLTAGAVLALLVVASVLTTRARNLDYADPVALWEANARLTPDNPRAYSQLGAYYMTTDRYVEAHEALRRAVELAEAGQGPAHTVRTHVYQQLGRLEDRLGRSNHAIAYLERSLEANPANYWSSHYLLRILFREGQLERAQEVAERARQEHPEAPAMGQNLILLDLVAGRDAEARLALADQLGLPPEDPQVARGLSNLARMAGRSGLAIELLRELRGVPAGALP